METVSKVHVQKLFAATEQQYKDKNKRTPPAGGSRAERRPGRLQTGTGRRKTQRDLVRRKRGDKTGGKSKGPRRRGTSERLDAAEQVLLLRGRQTG